MLGGEGMVVGEGLLLVGEVLVVVVGEVLIVVGEVLVVVAEVLAVVGEVLLVVGEVLAFFSPITTMERSPLKLSVRSMMDWSRSTPSCFSDPAVARPIQRGICYYGSFLWEGGENRSRPDEH